MEKREPMIEVVDDATAEVLRRMTGAERLRIVDGLCLTARILAEANIRAEHPDWDHARVKRAVAETIAGGPLPELKARARASTP